MLLEGNEVWGGFRKGVQRCGGESETTKGDSQVSASHFVQALLSARGEDNPTYRNPLGGEAKALEELGGGRDLVHFSRPSSLGGFKGKNPPGDCFEH